ncbi:hypothetical protein WA026_020472 [Henosepilachna vigintioctopunctata]|uniref:DNA repair protein Rev1 C-terminal domain-containing protein n=1 Tax=Henosepilachna vigintioctopunctata TaxID=420089 RepID=A0AAW1V9X2_9CUCU
METKSRIGRPTGSRSKMNNKNKSNSSPMLDKYLQNMMKTPTKINTILRSQNIDMDILHELPEELQNEIRIEYKQQIQLNGKNKKSLIKNKITEAKETQQKRSIFEGLNWKDLKAVLKAWMNSEAKPKKVDVEIISGYFRQLAINRKIEFLKMTLNFVHRRFIKMNCEWHRAYLSIVNTTQQGMVAQYGGTLLVERKFDCCGPKTISGDLITKL